MTHRSLSPRALPSALEEAHGTDHLPFPMPERRHELRSWLDLTFYIGRWHPNALRRICQTVWGGHPRGRGLPRHHPVQHDRVRPHGRLSAQRLTSLTPTSAPTCTAARRRALPDPRPEPPHLRLRAARLRLACRYSRGFVRAKDGMHQWSWVPAARTPSPAPAGRPGLNAKRKRAR